MIVAILWVIASLIVAELLGYFLHRLLHSDTIRFLSRSHMTHHLLLYGPLQQQRPGPVYFDATGGKIALGNIGLEWLAPAGLLLAVSLGAFRLFHVRPIHQLIFVATTLTWSFLMFSYLHDRMHIQGFWLARNRFSKHWFRKARRLHDIHHVSLNAAGLMNKNFGIGFFFFDHFFGTLSTSSRPFNRQGYEAAQRRYAFLREDPQTALASAKK